MRSKTRRLLNQIYEALLERDAIERYAWLTLRDLRKRFPSAPGAYQLSVSDLEEILLALPTADIESWRSPLSRFVPDRKSSLSDDEVRKLRSQGWTYSAIAKQAGISRQRVQQICRKKEN